MNSLIKNLRIRFNAWLFELACRVLLPISTMCKVCNILRGIVLGMFIGSALTCFLLPWFLRLVRWIFPSLGGC